MLSNLWYFNIRIKNLIMYYIVELFNNENKSNFHLLKTEKELNDFKKEGDEIIVFSNIIPSKLFDLFFQTKNEEDSLVYSKLLCAGLTYESKTPQNILNIFKLAHCNKFLQSKTALKSN